MINERDEHAFLNGDHAGITRTPGQPWQYREKLNEPA
jgi:hypothetical protein